VRAGAEAPWSTTAKAAFGGSQAEEFVSQVERGGVDAAIARACSAHPTCTLALLIVGLGPYLTSRERREFRCPHGTPAAARARLPCCDAASGSLRVAGDLNGRSAPVILAHGKEGLRRLGVCRTRGGVDSPRHPENQSG
jgi:hypothetical protein